MLRTRIITAVVGIPLLLGALYLGGLVWDILFGLMGFLALYEYLNMMRIKGFQPFIVSSYGILFVLLFREALASYCLPLLFAIILVMILDMVLRYPSRTLNDLAIGVFGAFYIGFLLSYAIALQADFKSPFLYIVLAFILTWSTDIGGYLFGRLFGKRKLTPLLSPNKTWAGAIGGICLTIILVLITYFILPLHKLTFSHLLVLGMAGSIGAQFGDLFESAMKRYFSVKDSGNIIPGHGGVLDRFDSFLVVLPIMYYFLTFSL